MQNLRLYSAALVLIGALSASSAVVAQQRPMMASGYTGPGMMYGGMMRGFDSNRDGAINREEFQSHIDSMFAVMDQDRSGSISRDEFLALHMGPGGAFGSSSRDQQKRKADRFAEIDKNRDGTIDRDEFNAWENGWFGGADPRGRGSVPMQRYRMMDRW